jgi:hypothetical protein
MNGVENMSFINALEMFLAFRLTDLGERERIKDKEWYKVHGVQWRSMTSIALGSRTYKLFRIQEMPWISLGFATYAGKYFERLPGNCIVG